MGDTHFTLTLRCTTKEKAERLVELGEIKFNTPQSWVEYEEKYGKGRGDVLEGAFAFCRYDDITQIVDFASRYSLNDGDIFLYQKDNRIYLKRKSSMNLPCFCVYILKNDSFIIPEERVGLQNVETIIPAKYFQDFSDNKTQEEIDALPDSQKPAFVIINGFDIFKERILAKLESIGIDRKDVLIEPITYYDFEKYGPYGWTDFNVRPPLELGIKSKDFEIQSELRFIINSKNASAMEHLRKNCIQIGSLADIAKWIPGSFSDGIRIEAKAYVEEKK